MSVDPLDDKIKLAFGTRLREARDAQSLSRRAFGGILGISPKTIQSWENGRTFIERLSLIPLINQTLETDVLSLLAEAIGEQTRKNSRKRGTQRQRPK